MSKQAALVGSDEDCDTGLRVVGAMRTRSAFLYVVQRGPALENGLDLSGGTFVGMMGSGIPASHLDSAAAP